MKIYIGIIRHVIHKVQQILYVKFIKKRKKCIVEKGAFIDRSCIIEGHNRFCSATNLIDCKIGRCTYFNTGAMLHHAIIGRYSSIGSNVKIINGRHPTSVFVSTFPAFFSTAKQAGFTYVNRDKYDEYLCIRGRYSVEVGNDVWIGSDVRIMGGLSIGDGAIIAAGAVVVKNVPPYAIVGGVPAHIIRYRFTDNQICSLLKFKWWEKSEDWIRAHAEDFDNIDGFLSSIEGKIQNDKNS